MKPNIHSIVRWVVVLIAMLAAPGEVAAGDPKKRDPDQIGNRDVGTGLNFYSLEKEMALGRQLARELEREAKLLDSPSIGEYVNRIAQNLSKNSDARVPVTAKVIDSQEVNAFALPGGFLYVHTGLILQAETEAELACVLSHEIAHVAARHATRQVSRSQVLNIASLPLILLGGWAGYAARQGTGLAVPLAYLKFSRAFEEEADLLGLQYVYKAGYDPGAFVDFFEKLETRERKKPGSSNIFRSHPPVAARIQATEESIQNLLRQQPQYVVDTSEFGEVRQELNRTMTSRRSEPAQTGPTLRRPVPKGDSSSNFED